MSATRAVVKAGRIEIAEPMPKHEIVRKVVNAFIDTEYRSKGKGIAFEYPVEDLPEGPLCIFRPGRKKNFDFKVLVLPHYGLGAGKHEDVRDDVMRKKRENPMEFEMLWDAITEIYMCSDNDVDRVLAKYPGLGEAFETGADVEVLVKVLKWFFIMEDIFYWDHLGRDFLYNFLHYCVRETDSQALAAALEAVKKYPDKLARFMKSSGVEWTSSGRRRL